NVVLKLHDSQLCLLLLGLLGMLISVHAPLGNLTQGQWFNIQHVNMTLSPCDDAVRAVNSHRRICKGQNTFFYTSYPTPL
ncbi:PREDICTED: non-secretory ribonuclease-like, partial [Galeopterus variegatus]|uniref:Non-secretory ribonuclease-like n=1 Tax=Galeopterus variegatus TaxID=482537 RepID=A0ABM0RP11_GALVR